MHIFLFNDPVNPVWHGKHFRASILVCSYPRHRVYSNYNKIENGNREISVKELQRLAEFYNITVDQVININTGLPKEVVIKDKQAQEQLRLIAELDTDDRAIIFKMIDKMLTTKKFNTFFQENLQQ